MRTARQAIGLVAERVAIWSSNGGLWRVVRDPRIGVVTRQRRSPVRFEDIDKFMALHAMVERRMGPLRECRDSGGIRSNSSFNPEGLPEHRRNDVQSWIEEFARGSRKNQWLSMSGAGNDSDYQWFIELRGDLASVSISGAQDRDSTAKRLDLLENAVEANTTPMRRRNRTLIESVRAPDAAQQRHDDELATRINRAGLLWGGIAGILGGSLVQGIVAILD